MYVIGEVAVNMLLGVMFGGGGQGREMPLQFFFMPKNILFWLLNFRGADTTYLEKE
jgi:hypothetical protein